MQKPRRRLPRPTPAPATDPPRRRTGPTAQGTVSEAAAGPSAALPHAGPCHGSLAPPDRSDCAGDRVGGGGGAVGGGGCDAGVGSTRSPEPLMRVSKSCDAGSKTLKAASASAFNCGGTLSGWISR